MSVAKQVSSSTSGTPLEVGAELTIDLRAADSQRECRQLRVRVQMARRRLDELESRRQGGGMLETHLGDVIVEAQNKVARERADARRAVGSLMIEAELESRRRVEAAREEASALLVVAQWLRSQGRMPVAGGAISRVDHQRDGAAGILDGGTARG